MIRILLVLLFATHTALCQIDSSEAQIPDVSYLKGCGGFILGGHFNGKTITGEIGYIKSNVTKVRDYRSDIRESSQTSNFYFTQPYSAVSIGSEFF